MNDYLHKVIHQKIYTQESILPVLQAWRLKSERIVFTNGCFDILHPGHADYLAKAKSLGHRLVVGINSDASVKLLNKGSNRPIQSATDRAFIVASLHACDAVLIFEEPTPLALIQLIKPDILVKGGDYDAAETNIQSPHYIVGSDIVSAYGGRTQVIPFLEGYSTTGIENKIKHTT